MAAHTANHAAPVDASPILPEASSPRPPVAAARRIVVKLGTQVLIGADGAPVEERMARVADAVAALRHDGREVILVSSGAVGLGRHLLGLLDDDPPPDALRACAAVGQGALVGRWQSLLAERRLTAAQMLLTEEDFHHRQRYLDPRATLDRLLAAGVVPVANENDAVTHGAGGKAGSTVGSGSRRAIFADNDRLAALVAAKCRADLLVLLTDVDGVYERDPRLHPDAALLDRIDDPGAVLAGIDDAPGSRVSRGGMRSKVEAARVAARGGCCAVIACGRDGESLPAVLAGERVGTWFPALGRLDARRGWIAYATATRGVLRLDAGAVSALRDRHASLLPVGVVAVEGRFAVGDVVELRGPDGALVGRGRMPWNADTVRKWIAGRPPEPLPNCLLRRDCFVLEA